MPTRTVFMTGFPGFIARQLLLRLASTSDDRYVFVVEPRFMAKAQDSITEIERHVPGFAARARAFPGDITQPRLGLDDADHGRLLGEVNQVWHLAAIYDLTVPAAVAYRVNVLGTANVLDFCEACTRFERLEYISTCYVSGERHGTVLEAELDKNQTYKNHYEATKAWAEMEVRRRLDRIPTTILRPGIVVGDSRTGETDKYDGPYFLVKALLQLPGWFPMVNVGRGEARVNIVPVDFVTDAMVALSRDPAALGLTFQLADPEPSRAREIVTTAMHLTGHGHPKGSIPAGLIDRALRVGPIQSVVPIPREAIQYFDHDVFHDSANTQRLLAKTTIRCPNFLSYLPTLVEYVRTHPEPGGP